MFKIGRLVSSKLSEIFVWETRASLLIYAVTDGLEKRFEANKIEIVSYVFFANVSILGNALVFRFVVFLLRADA